MKRIFFCLAFLLFWSFGASSQDNLSYSSTDTLTNADTVILYPLASTSRVIGSAYDYSILIFSDSLSGSTAGTAKIQYTNDGTLWYDYGSALTLNGPTQQTIHWEGPLYAQRHRIYFISTGTQSTKVRTRGYYRKR